MIQTKVVFSDFTSDELFIVIIHVECRIDCSFQFHTQYAGVVEGEDPIASLPECLPLVLFIHFPTYLKEYELYKKNIFYLPTTQKQYHNTCSHCCIEIKNEWNVDLVAKKRNAQIYCSFSFFNKWVILKKSAFGSYLFWSFANKQLCHTQTYIRTQHKKNS